MSTQTPTIETTAQVVAPQGEPTQAQVQESKAAPEVEQTLGETLDESETSETEGEEQRKFGKGFEKRIKKLSQRAAKAEQEKDYWRDVALKNQNSSKAEEPRGAAAKSADGKPTQDKFDTHEEWLAAIADWKIEQRLNAQEAKVKASELQSKQQSLADSFQKKVVDFKKSNTDWDEVMEDIDDIPLSITVREVLLHSDVGPELAYELAKNPKDLERICSLGAIDAARELGRIEARLSKSSGTQETKTTKASPPITPVGAKAVGAVKKSISDPDIPFADYEKLRREQMRKRA